MSALQPYLVGVTGGKTGQVIGPFSEDEVQAPVRGERDLRAEGAEEVFAVRATSHHDARLRVQAELRER